MVDPMHNIQLAKNILLFLKMLFGKAYTKYSVEVKTLKPQYVDIPHHDNVQVNEMTIRISILIVSLT